MARPASKGVARRGKKPAPKPVLVIDDYKPKAICASGYCKECADYQQPHALCYLVSVGGVVGMICSKCYERSVKK